MSLQMSLWEVKNNSLEEIHKSKLDSENRLENWLASDPAILGLDILIIGRQVTTSFGGKIDLLALDREGKVWVLELKRDKTPRDVTAQALDYGAWVKNLLPKDIMSIANNYLKEPLEKAFNNKFNSQLPENLNNDHALIIVASELDESSQRIVEYLADQYGVNINCIFFNFFKLGSKELLGRSWLMNPEIIEEKAESRKQLPWSGFFYVNVGEGNHRNWEDCVKYGFLSAGQGKKYSDVMRNLKLGDKVFAYMKGLGYVGFGEIINEAVMAKDFFVTSVGKKLFECTLKQPGIKENSNDPDLMEWVVRVNWLKTFPRNEAKTFTGIFANQNVVCKLRHQTTIDFLKREFQVF